MSLFGSNIMSSDASGCGYFFVPLVLILLFEQHAVLWGLSCLSILHSRPSSQRIKMTNISGLCIGLLMAPLLLLRSLVSFSIGAISTNFFSFPAKKRLCPLYYHLKFAFLVWLQLPSSEGASVMYMNHLRPFLRRHQARLDYIVNFFYGEMVKFASNHETEIQVAKTILTKILVSANQMVKEIMHPTQRQIGGPTPGQHVESSDSDSEDEE